MFGPDQTDRLRDPSNITNAGREGKERRIIKPEERDNFKKVLTEEERDPKTKAGKEQPPEETLVKERHPAFRTPEKKQKSEKKESATSVFDLSKKSSKEKLDKEMEMESAENFFEIDENAGGGETMDALSALLTDKKTKSAKGQSAHERENPKFATEQPDLSAIAEGISKPEGFVSAVGEKSAEVKHAGKIPEHLVELIDKLAEKMSVMQSKGQTDTTITLKHPPLFEGAVLTIRTFANAKGEFNVKFEGLSNAAKALIDLPLNQDMLRLHLENKGYILHMVTATTQIEAPEYAAKQEPFDRGQRERDGEQRQRQKQQGNQNDDDDFA